MTTMAKTNSAGTLLRLVTAAGCIAAIFNPRFRKACWSLLCRLG